MSDVRKVPPAKKRSGLTPPANTFGENPLQAENERLKARIEALKVLATNKDDRIAALECSLGQAELDHKEQQARIEALTAMLTRWQTWNDEPIKDLTLEEDTRALMEASDG